MTEPDVINAFKAVVFAAYVGLTAWAIYASLRHYPPDGRGAPMRGGTFEERLRYEEAAEAMLWCFVVLIPGGLALAGWFWG